MMGKGGHGGRCEGEFSAWVFWLARGRPCAVSMAVRGARHHGSTRGDLAVMGVTCHVGATVGRSGAVAGSLLGAGQAQGTEQGVLSLCAWHTVC